MTVTVLIARRGGGQSLKRSYDVDTFKELLAAIADDPITPESEELGSVSLVEGSVESYQ